MNTLEMKGNWNIIKGNLKRRWAQLTDDDLRYAEGQEQELLGRIQKRTGQTREAVERALEEALSQSGQGQREAHSGFGQGSQGGSSQGNRDSSSKQGQRQQRQNNPGQSESDFGQRETEHSTARHG